MPPKLTLLILLLASYVATAQQNSTVTIDSMLGELVTKPDDTAKVILLYDIAYNYSNVDPAKGIEYGQQAIALARHLDWQKGIATAHAMVGINHEALAEHDKALKFELEALKLYKEANNPKGVSAMLANISLIYSAQSKYSQALDYAFQALEINEELGNKSSNAIMLENIGTIYFRLMNYPKTLDYYSKAAETYNQLGDQAGLARNKGNVGMVLNEQGEYEQALAYHQEALEINQQLGLTNSVMVNHVNIGNAKRNLGDFPEALSHYLKAFGLSETLGNKGSTATTLGNIGIVYLNIAQSPGVYKLDDLIPPDRQSNLNLAISYLKMSITKCKALGYYEPMIEFNKEISLAYDLTGDFYKALQSYKQYASIKDSIHSLENEQVIANLESKRELALRDKDLELKNKQLQIQRLELKQKKTQITLYLLGCIILAIIAMIIWQRLNRSRRSYKTLSEENKEQLKQIETQIISLRKHSKVLKEIAYMQAHDVRGPVATLLGLTRLFNEKDPSDPDNKIIIEHIETVSQKLDKAVREVINKESELKRKG